MKHQLWKLPAFDTICPSMDGFCFSMSVPQTHFKECKIFFREYCFNEHHLHILNIKDTIRTKIECRGFLTWVTIFSLPYYNCFNAVLSFRDNF